MSYVWAFVLVFCRYFALSQDERKLQTTLLSLKNQGYQLNDFSLRAVSLQVDEYRNNSCCGDDLLSYKQREIDNEALIALWHLRSTSGRFWLPWVFRVLAVLYGVLLVAERKHYSVDVLLAIIVTSFVYCSVVERFPDSVKLKRKQLIRRLLRANVEMNED